MLNQPGEIRDRSEIATVLTLPVGGRVKGRGLTIGDVMTRALNLAIAVPALVLLSPLFALLAVAVRASGPGPIFYRGERLGKDMRVFILRKFRTMRVGAETLIGARLALPEDDVVTSVGRVLRKLKLDELPQLLNVVRGEMNLVGPRPVRPVFLPIFLKEITGYSRRFEVQPGITGLAQVRAGYYISPRNKLRYELLYIRRRTLSLDLMILAYTIRMVGRNLIGIHRRQRWSNPPLSSVRDAGIATRALRSGKA